MCAVTWSTTATRPASRAALFRVLYAHTARPKSMIPNTMSRKMGRMRPNSTSDWPRRPSCRRRFMSGSPRWRRPVDGWAEVVLIEASLDPEIQRVIHTFADEVGNLRVATGALRRRRGRRRHPLDMADVDRELLVRGQGDGAAQDPLG